MHAQRHSFLKTANQSFEYHTPTAVVARGIQNTQPLLTYNFRYEKHGGILRRSGGRSSNSSFEREDNEERDGPPADERELIATKIVSIVSVQIGFEYAPTERRWPNKV
jgi:hypothetical protein